MELRQLRYFVEIADRASFSRAAEVLSVAQPALTTQIQKLEAELRAQLFVRTTRGITLTEVGSYVLEEARRTLAAADATKRAAELASDAANARLVIAYSPIFPAVQSARVIRGLRRERPNVQVELREMSSRDQFAALQSGAVDMAFLQDTAHEIPSGIVRVPVVEEQLILAAPSTHPLASRRAVEWKELAHEPFIFPAADLGESVRDDILAACRGAGFQPRVVQEAREFRFLLGLVSAGIGIAILSSAARSFRMRGVSYASIHERYVIAFAMLYRRGLGGRSLAPFLRHIGDLAAS